MARKGMRSYSSAGESEATQPQHSDAQGRPRKHQQQGLLALKAVRIRRSRRRLSDCASRLGNCFNKATLNKWVRGGRGGGGAPCRGVPACRAKLRRGACRAEQVRAEACQRAERRGAAGAVPRGASPCRGVPASSLTASSLPGTLKGVGRGCSKDSQSVNTAESNFITSGLELGMLAVAFRPVFTA